MRSYLNPFKNPVDRQTNSVARSVIITIGEVEPLTVLPFKFIVAEKVAGFPDSIKNLNESPGFISAGNGKIQFKLIVDKIKVITFCF